MDNYSEIRRFGAVLRRMTHSDVEMVRRWRNSPEVSSKMEFRQEITPEMQERWFSAIDNRRDYYYIVLQDEAPLGLVNIKDVDFARGEGFGGVFLGRQREAKPFCGMRAMIAMYNFGFETLKLRRINGKILSDNAAAQRLNKMLGFQLEEGQEQAFNQACYLTKDSFMKHTAPLRVRFEPDTPNPS